MTDLEKQAYESAAEDIKAAILKLTNLIDSITTYKNPRDNRDDSLSSKLYRTIDLLYEAKSELHQ